MYADFSKERIDSFLRDIAGQPETSGFQQVSEDLMDDIMLAQMEMARFRRVRAEGGQFTPRAHLMSGRPRMHPADLH